MTTYPSNMIASHEEYLLSTRRFERNGLSMIAELSFVVSAWAGEGYYVTVGPVTYGSAKTARRAMSVATGAMKRCGYVVRGRWECI